MPRHPSFEIFAANSTISTPKLARDAAIIIFSPAVCQLDALDPRANASGRVKAL
jgi:hypothetical protein